MKKETGVGGGGGFAREGRKTNKKDDRLKRKHVGEKMIQKGWWTGKQKKRLREKTNGEKKGAWVKKETEKKKKVGQRKSIKMNLPHHQHHRRLSREGSDGQTGLPAHIPGLLLRLSSSHALCQGQTPECRSKGRCHWHHRASCLKEVAAFLQRNKKKKKRQH